MLVQNHELPILDQAINPLPDIETACVIKGDTASIAVAVCMLESLRTGCLNSAGQ